MDAAAPTHTFGGLAFDRNIFDFEIDAAGLGGDLGGASIDGDAPAAAPEAPAAPEPVQITAEDIAALRAVASALPGLQMSQQQMQQLLARATAPPPPAAPELPEYDPFNPESVAAHVQAKLVAPLEARIAELTQIAQGVQAKDGQAWAMSTLDQLKPALGDFNSDLAWAVSIPMLNDPNVNAQEALTFAARMVADDRKATWDAAYKAGMEANAQQLREAGGAIVDPAAGAGSAVIASGAEPVPGESVYRTAGRQALSRLRPAQVG